MKLLRAIGFDVGGKIFVSFFDNKAIANESLDFGDVLSWEFDTSKKYCVGWHEIQSGEIFPCPDNSIGETECAKCRARTGFNPAFYNTSNISEVQSKRNLEPHILYLAYFGGEIVKVGIAHHRRKLVRLLEQGALQAIVLDELPSANVARQYEEKIAHLDSYTESVQSATKRKLLLNPKSVTKAFDRLNNSQAQINSELQTNFVGKPIDLLPYYSNDTVPRNFLYLNATHPILSGKLVGLVGKHLLLESDHRIVCVSVDNYVGRNFEPTNQSTMGLPAEQLSLL